MPFEVIRTALTPWLQAAVTVGIAVLAALGVRLGMKVVVSRSTRLTESNLDRVVTEELTRPLAVTIVLVGVILTIPIFDRPQLGYYVGAGILSILILLWTLASIRLVNRSILVLRDQGRELEFAPVIRNLWTFFVLLVTIGFLLSIWGIDITPLLAGAGVAGIVIGIAAQDSIGNFIAGISLNLDRTYQIGHLLQLEDGTRGTVTSISVRSTTILTRDNIEVTIPNSYLNNTQVINESAPLRHRRIRLDVGVAYGSELPVVEETLIRVATEADSILEIPPPKVEFRSFDDSAIRAQLQCYISHPAQWGRARHELIKAIDVAFAEEGIKIPFPQRELTFYEAENEIRIEEQRDRDDDP